MSKDRSERRHRRTWRHPECIAAMANADFDAAPSLADALSAPTVEVIHDAPACEWSDAGWTEAVIEILPKGTLCTYCGHTAGGMIHVKLTDGRHRVIHPGTTRELS